MKLSHMLRGELGTESQLQARVSWAWKNRPPESVPESEHRLTHWIRNGVLEPSRLVLRGVLKVKGAAA